MSQYSTMKWALSISRVNWLNCTLNMFNATQTHIHTTTIIDVELMFSMQLLWKSVMTLIHWKWLILHAHFHICRKIFFIYNIYTLGKKFQATSHFSYKMPFFAAMANIVMNYLANWNFWHADQQQNTKFSKKKVPISSTEKFEY